MIAPLAALAAIGLQGPILKVGDRDVPLTWPEDRPVVSADDTRFEFEGHTFFISPNGLLRGPFVGDGSNRSYQAAFERGTPKTTDSWRVRVHLATATDILDHGSAMRTRRGYLDKKDVDTVYSALAQFAAMASAESRGRYTFAFDIESDAEPQFQVRADGQVPFDSKWLAEYLWPRFNGFDFQADDKVFRGPYDSVFVIHGGLTPNSSRATLHGTLAHAIPFYAKGAWFGQDSLARGLLQAWNEDVAHAAHQNGFAVPQQWTGRAAQDSGAIGAAAFLKPSAKVGRTEFKENAGAAASLKGIPGKEADDVAIRKLGALTEADLAELAGTAIAVREVGDAVVFGSTLTKSAALDGTLGEDESAAYIRVRGPRDLLFVRPSCARLFAGSMPDAADARVHGFLIVGRHCMTVLSILDREAKTEADLLGKAHGAPAPNIPREPADVLFDGRLEAAKAYGTFTLKAASDQGIEVSSGFGSRLGALILYESDSPIDFGAKPYLKLRWRSGNAEPMSLTIREMDGTVAASFQMFGQLPAEGDAPPYADQSVYGTPAEDWQETIIRVPAGVVGRTIALESDPRTAIWGGNAPGNPTVAIASLTVSKTGPELAPSVPSAAVPSPDSQRPDLRARWAYAADASDAVQQAKLIALLSDRNDSVKLNAAYALGKVKDPKVETALATALATLDPRVAQQCTVGLLLQDTETAYAAVSRQVMSAASEWSKLFVIRALAERKDVRLAGLLSGVYASRSYQVRAEGARALGMMAGREPALLVSVFLQESSPVVRLMATRYANAELDPICRKVLFSAVNDPLDAVRIASYQKLFESSYETFRAEGLKGIRDDSVYVRLALLENWRSNPSELARPAIRLGVADTDPRVRAAALLAMSTIPGPVTAEEIGPATADDDPRVVAALAELKRAKGLGD